jgi:PAS domain S-box-containing protein
MREATKIVARPGARRPKGVNRRAGWSALLAGAVIAAGVLALWREIDIRAHEHVDSSTRQAAYLMQLLIRQDVEHRFLALDRLAQRWTATGGKTRDVWEADANSYITDMPGFASIERIIAGNLERWSVRDPDVPQLHDPDISRFEAVKSAIETAHAAGESAVSEVFGLGDAGTCVAVVMPVLNRGTRDGIIAGVLQLQPWLDVVLGDVQTAEHHVLVRLNGIDVYRHDADLETMRDAHTESVNFETRGLEWSIDVTPASGFLSAGHADSSTLVLIVGLLFSALVSTAVYLALVARAQSRESREAALRFEALIQNLPGMAYRRTNDGERIIKFVSDGCRALTGYSRDELNEGRVRWEELTHPDDRERVAAETNRALLSRVPFELEYRITDRGGKERWVWERGRLVDSALDDVPHVEGIVSDISDGKRAEIEARQHREHLAHADRLNMLGEMATGIAHEINQPLTAISLFVQAGSRMLENRTPERLPEIFDKLVVHAHRASDVIERMQTMARRHESAKEVTDCDKLMHEVAKLAEAEARIRDMTIEVATEVDLPDVDVDAVQIQQVALNLLRNGMESMRSIDCVRGKAIGLHARLDGDGYIEIAVVDKGTGVTDDVAKILFAPFSTTKKSGMGLGLSISRAIITAHGGRLDFHNNESGGATFFFTLPPVSEGDANER